jgi:hypothetical protein
VKFDAAAREHATRVVHGRHQVVTAGQRVAVGADRALARSRAEQNGVPAFRHFAAAPIASRILVEHSRKPAHLAEAELVVLLALTAEPILDRCCLVHERFPNGAYFPIHGSVERKYKARRGSGGRVL